MAETRASLLVLLAGLAVSATAAGPVRGETADAAAESPPAAAVLPEVVVTGVQPGPGLWRVRHPQGEGDVWILATVNPLPSAMQWNPAELESILATADEVIAPPRVEMDIGAGDMFKMASLARAANAAIKLPDGDRLRDRLPAPLHARWLLLKARHLPDDGKLERQRPLFASQTLYYEAIRDAGLTQADTAWTRVAGLAAAHEVPVRDPVHHAPLAIDRKAYRAGIRAVADSQVDDVPCFAATLDALDADIAHFIGAANAWARGDIDSLLPMQLAAPLPPCKPVYDQAMSFQHRPQLRLQALQAWRAAVEAALAGERTALAVLALPDLLGPAGMLEQLQAQGYEISPP